MAKTSNSCLSKLVLSLGIGIQISLTKWAIRLHDKSRMNREVHVRFCERFRGGIPLYLLDWGDMLLIFHHISFPRVQKVLFDQLENYSYLFRPL